MNADLESLITQANKDTTSQIAKYLHLSPNLILTDYLRFIRVHKDERGVVRIAQSVKICDLCDLPHLLHLANSKQTYSQPKSHSLQPRSQSTLQDIQNSLLDFFKLFFSATPKPISTALEFTSSLASRTKMLKDSMQDFKEHSKISSLYESFKEILYKELDFETFCDSFAQTLTYSLFLAKLNDKNGESISLYNAESFIPNSFPLIKAMSGFLRFLDTNRGSLNSQEYSLDWLISEILAIINHIDMATIIKELNKIIERDLLGDYMHKDPYLHFYETFLSRYDPNLRELRGVYYTPYPVVSFIINAIDSTLKNDFKLEGLKSALNNENITLLDFATGTGTFLLESFRKALEELPTGYANKDKIKSLIKRFNGFEFLIAPYTIAHLKLSQTLKEERNIELNDNERFNIYLTNTLYNKSDSDEINEKSTLLLGLYELAQEFKEAQQIKRQQILIITGNPPYSGASANKGLFEDEVRIAYGLEPSLATLSKNENDAIANYLKNPNSATFKATFKAIFERKKLQNEKTTKWLLDDYVKFIRFAQSKIEAQANGIIAIISNNSFLDNPTFRGMRWHLLNSFDKIYILNLHGNTRKKELSPDGSKDDNVFDIRQGVCISVFVKISHHNKPKPPIIYTTQEPKIEWHSYHNAPQCQVFYYDLYGKRNGENGKYDFLLKNSLDSIQWNLLYPKAPFYLFIPQNESLLEEYNEGWSVKDIFKISSVGITSARDSFCMSDSHTEQSLQDFKQRVARFIELDIESARREFELGKDSRDWKVEFAQNELKKTGNNPNNYVLIHYRPFDYRYTYYTGKSKGFHSMPRGEVMKHFLPCESDNANPLDCSETTFIESAESNDKKASATSKKAKNVGLSMPRQLKTSQNEWNHILVTENITDQALTSGGNGVGVVHPLYLNPDFKENFTPKFRDFIDAKYEEHFSPETILGYIYAVLYHKDYRSKYLDFLKIDFPKIPFVKSKEKFLALSKLGLELMSVHLLRERENRI